MVVAGRAVGDAATDIAVIAKMIRVMLLAPFLVLLSLGLSERSAAHAGAGSRFSGIMIPWFAFGFAAVVAFNSLAILPRHAIELGTVLDNILLSMAMAAIGLTTHMSALRRAGVKPLLLALLLFFWLLGGGAAINGAVQFWLG